LTVVRGLLFTVDCLTNRPVIALRPTFPLAMRHHPSFLVVAPERISAVTPSEHPGQEPDGKSCSRCHARDPHEVHSGFSDRSNGHWPQFHLWGIPFAQRM
jgi:hypothetical protein